MHKRLTLEEREARKLDKRNERKYARAAERAIKEFAAVFEKFSRDRERACHKLFVALEKARIDFPHAELDKYDND
jgi:hypothetical protein